MWTYDPAPYVLGKTLCLFHRLLCQWTSGNLLHTKRNFAVAGYYANGPLVTFVAICRPPEDHDVPNVINIANSNLALRRERILHFRRMINLSIIIEQIQDVIGFRETVEFIPIVR